MAEDEGLFKDFEKYKKDGEKKEDKKMDEKEIVIKFKFKPIMVERIVYWVIIVALIILVIFNPLSNVIKCDYKTTTSAELEAGGAIITDTNETEQKETGEAPKTEEKKEEKQTPTTLSDKVIVAISSITVEKDSEGNPIKVTEVKFSIDNQKEDFRPQIKIFWYDEDDLDEIKNLLRAGATFPTLPAGTSKDYKITKFVSKYLSPDNKQETLYVKIYNAETESLLAEANKKVE